MFWKRPLIGAFCVVLVACGMSYGVVKPRRPAGDEEAPKVGEKSPPFKLMTLDKKREVELASFAGKRPVILFFGSYT